MIATAHVIGMGRLGRHLADRLETIGVNTQRWSRTADDRILNMEDWSGHAAADAIFLAVPDDALPAVAARVAEGLPASTLLVHHAGAVPADVLPVSDHQRAVMWPPMTFGHGTTPDWDTLPLGVEADRPDIMEWATLLATRAFPLTSESRRALHLCAVLAGNLTAAWIGMVEEHLGQAGLDIAILEPLIVESVHKALEGQALSTVSGPASRNDRHTLADQVEALGSGNGNPPELAALHRILTNRILQAHGHPELPPIQAAPRGH